MNATLTLTPSPCKVHVDPDMPVSFAQVRAECLEQLRFPVHRVEFCVGGKPTGLNRARVGKVGNRPRMFDPKENKVRKADIVTKFRQTIGKQWLAWDRGPILVEVMGVHQKPADWWPGKHCTSTPDCDQMEKLVNDALNKVGFRDDRMVPLEVGGKTYGDYPGLYFRVTFFEAVEKPRHGRIKNGENITEIWENGTFLGQAVKDGSNWWASAPKGLANLVTISNPYRPDGNFRTLAQAEAAIREEVES